MTIKVYPHTKEIIGEPIEVHEWEGTYADFILSTGHDPSAPERVHTEIRVNDRELTRTERETLVLKADDDVRVWLQAAYGDPITWAVAAAIALAAASFAFMPRQRGQARSATAQGVRLDVASTTANQVKLGDVVPEIAGRHKRYPDYLTPPHRYFINQREQWLEFMVCVGVGHYSIDASTIKIGDSQFSGLGNAGSYTVHAPGEDISHLSQAQHWHSVDEVGGTSNGSAGLELSVTPENIVMSPVPSFDFSGNSIKITNGVGTYPAGWGAGTTVNVTPNRPLNYLVYLQSGNNRFSGNFAHLGSLGEGALINVNGAGLNGSFQARSVYIDGNGQGSIELWRPPVPPSEGNPGSDALPVNTIASGDYTMSFSRTMAFYLASTSATEIVVAGHYFPAFQSAATIAYVSGYAFGSSTSLFSATPANEKTGEVELDFFFPNGLAVIQPSGGLAARTVTVEIRYRDRDVGGPFTSILRSFTQNTLDQVGFTERIFLPAMRPEIMVRRATAPSYSTEVRDTVQWYGLKSRLQTKSSYPGWTTMSLRFRSGGVLGAQAENQINLIAARMLPTLQPDGSWGPLAVTRDISAFARYITQTIGYSDDNIDMAELERLHGVWSSRGETLDFVYEETTVKEALDVAFGAGMAELTLDDGLIKPVRDDVRTQMEQGYSPQNMLGLLQRSFRSRRVDDHDGVEVEYIDGTTWTKETVKCLLPGDAGFKLLKIKLDGVTNRTRAWRIGMRERRKMRYRNREYSFKTELDALNSGYLSYCPLIDDIPGYGQSAILHSITPVTGGALLRVSEPLEWTEGQTHVVAYRRPNGDAVGPFEATPGPDDYSVIADIPQPWPVVTLKHEPPHVYFGTQKRWSFPALITEISPEGNLESVSVKAVNYDERVYADDNNTPD